MKEKVLENRVSLFPNNNGIKRCPWGRQTTQEGNNTSNQGAFYRREVTFEALWKMFPCFCLPLFTTGLMKKKDDKYVYRKRTHSIIHHLVGVQYIYAKRNLFSYSPTMNGHLRLKYGSEHCPPVYALELSPACCPGQNPGGAFSSLALLFPYLQPLPSPNTTHAGWHPKLFCGNH